MFTAEIRVRLALEADPDEIYGLLGCLRRNGQILGKEYAIAQTGRMLRVYALVPEPNALHKSHDSRWVRESRRRLVEKGLTHLRVGIVGNDPTSRNADTCSDPRDYILFTHYLTTGSPLRCGECFDPVPLYRVPPTCDKSKYYSVGTWESDYQACDTLQMNCSTGERFGIREMSEADSSLSRRGRQLCADIEKSSGKPVYYYLLRYMKQTTTAKEEARSCPICGGAWLLESPWHIFDFKCAACRLVSTLSPTVA